MTVFLFLLCAIAAILLMGGYYTYRIAFYSPKKGRDKISTLASHKYGPYRKEINRLFCQLSDRPYEEVSIVSFDGLTLFGRYYHVKDGAPLDIGFHGYRSSALTDFAGGSELSFSMGHNLLLVDERAHGRSEGRTITFGIQERWDADSWVRYAVERFGADTEIILYGISMGAATVLMAAGLDLPENVKGIIADCPYSSPRDIIRKVAKDMHMPDRLSWPFAFALSSLLLAVLLTSTVRFHFQSDPFTWAFSVLIGAAGILAAAANTPLAFVFSWTVVDILEIAMLGLVGGGKALQQRNIISSMARIGGIFLVLWAMVSSRSSSAKSPTTRN